MKNIVKIVLLMSLFNTQYSFVNAQQNLVPNPSFEDTISCPLGIGDLSVVGWVSPTLANPDYFHSCNLGDVGVPQNGFGWQNPRSGNAYTGGHTSDFTTTDYREYIQCQLDSVLQAGHQYEVSFYVSRSDSSTKACDNIGAYLSSTAITSSNNQYLSAVPQVASPSNAPITDPNGWTQIIDTIIAGGGEQFLTIGVFTDNANTNWIPVSGGWESEAHYYYDDVSVIRLVPNSINELVPFSISMHPNPSNGIFKVVSNKIIEEILVFSSIGKLILTSKNNEQIFNIDLSEFAAGIYYINLKTNNEIIQRKLIID